MDLKGKKINFLGDSITQGVGVEKEENIYLNRLKNEAYLALTRNYGISGTRLANQRGEDKCGASFSQRFQDMAEDADIIVVFGGTNDYGHGNAPLGTFEARNPDTYYGACHYLMRGLIEKYPEALIVFMTPLHRENENQPSMGNRLPLSKYVDIIKEVAGYYAIPVLDLYRLSGIQPQLPVLKEKYCPDGLHPNDAGHELICARLKGFLESL